MLAPRRVLPGSPRKAHSLSAKMASFSNTDIHLCAFDDGALDIFLLDSTQRGFFFRAYNVLHGRKTVRTVDLDYSPLGPPCWLAAGH